MLFALGLPSTIIRADASPPDVVRAGQLDDIKVFRRDFLNVDRSYSASARSEAERRLAKLEQGNVPIDRLAFSIEICRIAALANNGHTGCFRRSEYQVPVEFRPLGGHFYVIGAANARLLGARVMSIDGHPVRSIVHVGRSLQGGTDAWRDQVVARLLRAPPDLRALGLAGSAGSATYAFRLRDGHRLQETFTAYPVLEGPQLVRLPINGSQPWANQEPNEPFRLRDAPELDAIVVQLRQNSDSANKHAADFLQQAEAKRAELERANVVLDMRQNGGGDLQLTRDFLIGWPARVPGKIFVLEGSRTFSAAISSIGYLKQSGGKKVILVGAPPGDRLMFFAEGKNIVLPHATIGLLTATERHDYRNGCRTFTDCSASIAQPGGPTAASNPTVMAAARIPIAVPSLDPEIKAEPTIDDLIAGRDAGMEAIADYLRRRRR